MTKDSSFVVVGDGSVETVAIGPEQPLAFLCGPCVIEDEAHAILMAGALKKIALDLKIPLIYKSSFDKANRTSSGSFRGQGRTRGLEILGEVRKRFQIPVVTDVHSPEDAVAAAAVVDLLQIPAFLCRQTDLLVAAGQTKRPIMIKKGQFLAPEDMQFARDKILSTGNTQVVLCERGSCFGYRDLVVDFRGLNIMRGFSPVVFDATHSVQIMGGAGGKSGGNRAYVAPLARAAVAFGVDAVFLECHQDPDNAPSDGPNMVPLDKLVGLLKDLKTLHNLQLETR